MRREISGAYLRLVDIKPTDHPPVILTAQQLAEYLRVPVKSVYHDASIGKIPCFRVGTRRLRFDLDDVLGYLKGADQESEM